MKKPQKLIALVLVLCMGFTLAACGLTRGGGKSTQTITVHARVPSSWRAPICAWAWKNTKDVFDAWPGEPMSRNGTWYEISIPSWANCVIINGSGGEVQTPDLGIEPGYDVWIIANSDGSARICYEEPDEPAEDLRTPDFVEYGLDRFVSLLDPMSFVTECADDASKETTGYFTVTADETTPRSDGWEDRHIQFQVSFSDSNAETYSPRFYFLFEDYYDSKLMNDTVSEVAERSYSYQVNWNGELHQIEFSYTVGSTGWVDHELLYLYDFYYVVPAGYDGVVLGVTRPIYDAPSDYIYDYATDDTLFYRAA
ncbi:MAG: starch-binding protein [Oscillospiraceae bacterium]|nr:starch-binding protein [Oscillospiraceae bacterium]